MENVEKCLGSGECGEVSWQWRMWRSVLAVENVEKWENVEKCLGSECGEVVKNVLLRG